jgi:hypothetical protein
MCVVFVLTLQSKKRAGHTCLKWTDTFVLTGQKSVIRMFLTRQPEGSKLSILASLLPPRKVSSQRSLPQSRRQPYLSRTCTILVPGPDTSPAWPVSYRQPGPCLLSPASPLPSRQHGPCHVSILAPFISLAPIVPLA